jgi:hypothetical protein
MKKLFLILYAFLFVILSCEENKDYPPESLDFELLEWANCSPLPNNNMTSYVIRNQSEYSQLQEFIQNNTFCLDTDFPEVDFYSHSILGIQVEGGGCSTDFYRDFLVDVDEKKYIYKIDAVFVGSCYLNIITYNWIKVNRLRDDFNVEFDVEVSNIEG